MRLRTACAVCTLVLLVGGCSGASSSSAESDSGQGAAEDAGDAASIDGGSRDTAAPPADASDAGTGTDANADAESDAGTACSWGGAPGLCITTAACAAIADHSSFAGECPGPASIECCISTPDPADNPPIPAGYVLMQQSQVTPAMTTWAVSILDDPKPYPMFATTTMTFGSLMVLARVEWHPPDFQNNVVHRGVTLYEPG